MTSEEAIQNAIEWLKDSNAFSGTVTENRTRLANSWIRVAEFLRDSEQR